MSLIGPDDVRGNGCMHAAATRQPEPDGFGGKVVLEAQQLDALL
jgi:hypothetical protein